MSLLPLLLLASSSLVLANGVDHNPFSSTFLYHMVASQDEAKTFLSENGEIFFLSHTMAPGRSIQLRLGDPLAKPLPSHHEPIPITGTNGAFFQDTFDSCHRQTGRHCVSSREAMVSFVGEDAAELATTHAPADKIRYYVNSTKVMVDYGAGQVVVCHPLPFPFPVMGCHRVHESAVYGISLVAVLTGKPVHGIAVCHSNTGSWSPEHLAFKVLRGKVKPPICHFLQDSAVVWTRPAAPGSLS